MENYGKTAVFRADMAGLGKYSMGGYGRIGVYRVRSDQGLQIQPIFHQNMMPCCRYKHVGIQIAL